MNYFASKFGPFCAGAEERVLVTGGSGFIGTNLVELYRDAPGFTTLNIDNVPPRNPDHRVFFQRGDITDPRSISAMMREFSPSVIYHLAARTDMDGKSIEDYPANTVGTQNVIRAIRELPTRPRTLFASSRLVCKIGYMPQHEADYCATTPYGKSKIEFEKIVRSEAARHFEWMIFRPTSIWGQWFDIPYRNFFDAVRRGRYLHPRETTIRKSFGFVGNTVYQLDRLAYSGFDKVRFATIYLCDYEPLDVYQWAIDIAKTFGRSSPYQVPEFGLRALAWAGDVFELVTHRHALLTSFRLDNLLTEMIHDTSLLNKAVGPLPFTTEEGVRLTTEWLCRNG